MIRYIAIFIWMSMNVLSITFAKPFYEKEQWLDLLYYKKTKQGFISLVETPEFFISPNGKKDPKEEYFASLKKTIDQDAIFKKKFPLRYKRLALSHHIRYLPHVTSNTTVTGVMIAYPNRYMANPASMFGHLFLVLNSPNGLADSTMLHFLAATEMNSEFTYIYKGISGQFKGQFLQEPYYRKIKEYTYRDDRDVLFYDLKLSPQQIEDLQLHYIELNHADYRYYFFDENCAFFIGKLLNVILDKTIINNPSLVLPSDIINTLNRKNFITNEYYRGSATRRFNTAYADLSREEQKAVTNLILMPETSPSLDSRILKPFLYISDHLLNNYGQLAEPIRKNRILAYQTLQKRNDSVIRPHLEKRETAQPILSKGLKLDYQFGEHLHLTYHTIYYNSLSPSFELESKRVSAFSPGLILTNSRPTLFELSLFDITNITAHNAILKSNSWRFKSWFAYNPMLYTDQDFGYGKAFRPFSRTLVTGLAGFTLSNYDSIANKPMDTTSFKAQGYLELTQLISNQLKTTLSYDIRYANTYTRLSGIYKKNNYEGRVSLLQSNEKNGLELSLIRSF